MAEPAVVAGIVGALFKLINAINDVVTNIHNAHPAIKQLNERCQAFRGTLEVLQNSSGQADSSLEKLQQTLETSKAFVDKYCNVSFLYLIYKHGHINSKAERLKDDLNSRGIALNITLATIAVCHDKEDARDRVKVFKNRFQSNDLKQALANLENHYKASNHKDLKAWAKSVYVKFNATNGQDKICEQLNLSRRFSLQLVYDIVDYWQSNTRSETEKQEFEDELNRVFTPLMWERLLDRPLALDRAQALYRLTPNLDLKAQPGIDWYAQQHLETKSDENLEKLGFFQTKAEQKAWIKHVEAFREQYPTSRPPMNWRLFFVLFHRSLQLGHLRHWATPTKVSSVERPKESYSFVWLAGFVVVLFSVLVGLVQARPHLFPSSA